MTAPGGYAFPTDGAYARVEKSILALSEAIRTDPELSGDEVRAARRCVALLAAAGFEVEEGTGGLPTAFRARRKLGAGTTRAAFLAEYDALPGIGHGCGHHLIAATSLGAALAASLAAAPGDDLELQVIGTPAEETIGGKVVLADDGIFDGLDAVLVFHPGHEWRTVTDSLACQSVEVVFGGRASHAVAAPEAGVNALDAMIDLFTAVRGLRDRLPFEVRIPGVILEGGVRANIVPDRAVARFSARAPSSSERETLVEALLGEVAAIAGRYGARSLVRPVDNPYDEMRTNIPLAAALAGELAARGCVVNDAPRKGRGSVDIGNVSRRAPAVHAYLPAAPEGVALHTREFGEQATAAASARHLATAACAMAAVALRLAREPALKSAVRAGFEDGRAGGAPRRWPLLRREPRARVEC